MRTPQQALKDAIKSGAVQAWIDGKKVQHKPIDVDGDWEEAKGQPGFMAALTIWRPAPEPKLRPWKPKEVPVGALYRWNDFITIILAASNEGIWFVDVDGNITANHYKCQLLSSNSSHSTDNGKTWSPCGVVEGEE